MTEKHELAAGIAERIGSMLREEFPDRSDLCVLATKTGLDVFDYFGIEAKPIVVRAMAYNERWSEAARLGWHIDDPRWQEAIDDGAWNVVIDETDHGIPGRYPGHLILTLPEEKLLLDLSLRQFSRPQHAMEFPDVGFFDLPENFMVGEPLVIQAYASDGRAGGYIGYRRRTSFPNFRRGPDWKLKSPLSGPIIRELKGRA